MASNAVKVEVTVKSEPMDEAPQASSSGTKDGGDSDLEKKKQYMITANQELREAIKLLSERQAVLEEYVEVELGGEPALQRYRTNKKRMKYVTEIREYADEKNADGTRSEKYKKMMRLMKLANGYWKRVAANSHYPTNREARLRYENGVPPEMAELRLHVDFDTGYIRRKPVKRCHKCFDESHEMKFCPYKHVESRTPEVMAMIEARLERLKETEGRDPLLSQAYKKRMYFKEELKEDKKRKREAKKQKWMAKKARKQEAKAKSENSE